MTRRTRRSQRGFTLIEIMMAIGIMTVGAVAIMSMIQASTRGNAQARMLSNATQNTQLWIDRLQRLSMRWTVNSQTGVTGIPYLYTLSNATATDWFTPGATAGADGRSGLDWQGNPRNAGDSRLEVCTVLHLSWISVGRSMRAEVISYFPRVGTNASTSGTSEFTCAAETNANAIVDSLALPTSRLGSVRAATVLRWRPLP